MTNLKIHNAETGEIVEREMTESEFTMWQSVTNAAKKKAEQDSAKAAQKAALLDRLGLTEEEAKLLLA
jgi:alkylated DNA nucleotide flippase Atl1